MAVVKEYRFPASVRWLGGRLTETASPGLTPLDVASPAVFKGGIEGVWSPEELLVGSAASCLAITLAGVAEARGVVLDKIEIEGVGRVEKTPAGLRFVAVELVLEVEAEGEHPHVVQALVEEAEGRCVIAAALEVAVSVRLRVATAAGVALSG